MPRTPKRARHAPREGARFLADVVASNVSGYRAMRKLSQRHLAHEMRELGHQWSASTVSDVENGDRSVAVDELVGLALILDTNVPALLDPGGIDGNSTEALDYGGGATRVEIARAWLRGKIVMRRWTDEAGEVHFHLAPARDTSPDALEILSMTLSQAFGRDVRQPGQGEESR